MDSIQNIFYNKDYPIDQIYPVIESNQIKISIHDGNSYALLDGKKIFLPWNVESSYNYWRGVLNEQLHDHPHCYLECDGKFIIKEGDIIADVGAAEGFLAIQHIEKIKHAYIFEVDDTWFKMLQKTYEPYKDKVTLVKGFVGDGEENISLDKYFSDKEAPTFY